MNPHRRLRPEHLHPITDPDLSDLVCVPQVFIHQTCQQGTHLNAATVRRYLLDPFRLLGAGASVYCACCRKNIPAADCVWSDTGENVRAWFRLLIGEALFASPYAWIGRFLMVWLVVAPLLIAVLPLAYLSHGGDRLTAEWISLGAAILVLVAFGIHLISTAVSYRNCAREYQNWQASSSGPTLDDNR